MVRVRGAYALAVLFADYPDEIYVARKDSPMVIGISDEDTYLASDVPAMLEHTRDVYYIDNLEMARLRRGKPHSMTSTATSSTNARSISIGMQSAPKRAAMSTS